MLATRNLDGRNVVYIRKILAQSDFLFSSKVLHREPMILMLIALVDDKNNGGISVTSLCCVTEVTFTTALRYVDFLEREGWLQRSEDKKDHRCKIVRITEAGENRMITYFDKISEIIKQHEL